ncbi:unnamed protein product [Calicophoron daubneyi]|uniref:EF-hand domain-containing protein n=1 Tax=Calicophoron daubneyi TaxID=300641 RepID=A0AAV2TQF5_CALDB
MSLSPALYQSNCTPISDPSTIPNPDPVNLRARLGQYITRRSCGLLTPNKTGHRREIPSNFPVLSVVLGFFLLLVCIGGLGLLFSTLYLQSDSEGTSKLARSAKMVSKPPEHPQTLLAELSHERGREHTVFDRPEDNKELRLKEPGNEKQRNREVHIAEDQSPRQLFPSHEQFLSTTRGHHKEPKSEYPQHRHTGPRHLGPRHLANVEPEMAFQAQEMTNTNLLRDPQATTGFLIPNAIGFQIVDTFYHHIRYSFLRYFKNKITGLVDAIANTKRAELANFQRDSFQSPEGPVSYNELVSATPEEVFEWIRHIVLNDVFQELDYNHDGFISITELDLFMRFYEILP